MACACHRGIGGDFSLFIISDQVLLFPCCQLPLGKMLSKVSVLTRFLLLHLVQMLLVAPFVHESHIAISACYFCGVLVECSRP